LRRSGDRAFSREQQHGQKSQDCRAATVHAPAPECCALAVVNALNALS
jgi:hypothetical protein